MRADVEVLFLPYASASGDSLAVRLIQHLRSGQWTRFRAGVAFAKSTGNVPELVTALSEFANAGHSVQLTFGADTFSGENPGSEYDAIRTLVHGLAERTSASVSLYREQGRIFHPKVFLFDAEGENRALLVAGSSNWSEGGLIRNVEASVLVSLDLTRPEHLELYRHAVSIVERFWQESDGDEPGQGFARRVTTENLESFAPLLKAQERAAAIATRAARRIEQSPEAKKAAGQFGGKHIALPPMPKAAINSPAGGARVPSATPKRPSREPAVGSVVWRKKLSATDAQRQPGNPTGDLRLTQARFVFSGGYINHTVYFRETVFGGQRWTIESRTPLVEVAHVPFEVTVLGESLGIHTLEVSHKPTGEAGQGNYTTGIRWGTLATRIRRANVVGKTLTLSAPGDDADSPFQIAIS